MRDHLMLWFDRHAALQTGEDVVLESAEGVHVVDTRGRRYLDVASAKRTVMSRVTYSPRLLRAL
jgi:4-aminobutyrate aminotransferase-like enzyme